MDQEYKKYLTQKTAEARQTRYRAGESDEVDGLLRPTKVSGYHGQADENERKPAIIKRDFFGKVVRYGQGELRSEDNGQGSTSKGLVKEPKVWVSFHEGFSNAVRKPITLEELMRGF